MLHKGYFVISPKPALTARLKESGALQLSDLLQPVLWSADEPDKGLLLDSDTELLVKLLFLDTLRRERGHRDAFRVVFKNIATTEEYFDSFWSLDRTPLDMSAEDAIEDAIVGGSIDALMESSNDRIKEVLSIWKERSLPKVR